MTQRFRKIDVSESINCNNIVSTSVSSLFNSTGIQKSKEIYCDSLSTPNIECTNISIAGTVIGTGIGGGSGIKTSYNISNSIPFFSLTSHYDIYTSIRTTDLSISIDSIFQNITNDNQLKNFYIYIENFNDTFTNPLSIYLNLIVQQNRILYYEKWEQNQDDTISKKLLKFLNIPSYEIEAGKFIILEIVPFIYPKYNPIFEFLYNDIIIIIKNYMN